MVTSLVCYPVKHDSNHKRNQTFYPFLIGRISLPELPPQHHDAVNASLMQFQAMREALEMSVNGEEEGAIKFDEAEVSEVRWVSPSELRREVEEAPERFTPWFLAELRARPELLLQQGG